MAGRKPVKGGGGRRARAWPEFDRATRPARGRESDQIVHRHSDTGESAEPKSQAKRPTEAQSAGDVASRHAPPDVQEIAIHAPRGLAAPHSRRVAPFGNPGRKCAAATSSSSASAQAEQATTQPHAGTASVSDVEIARGDRVEIAGRGRSRLERLPLLLLLLMQRLLDPSTRRLGASTSASRLGVARGGAR